MPLVRIHKAKAKPKLNSEQRQKKKIADNREPEIRAAFRKLARSLYTPIMLGDMRKAIEAAKTQTRKQREKSADAVAAVAPTLKNTPAPWIKFRAEFERILSNTVADSANAEAKRHKWPMRFGVKKDERLDISVPINPDSVKFIKKRAAKLVVDIDKDQEEALRKLLLDNFERNTRPEVIMDEIQDTVGLTTRETEWSNNRYHNAIAQGIPEDVAAKSRALFTKKLLKNRGERIARTETIDAISEGLLTSWHEADNEGLMPKGTKKKWDAILESPNVSKICKELDEHEAIPIDQAFHSSYVGDVQRPPAHPNCRSTLTLKFP